MLCSTFDLITQATSSHFYVFCFFNLIFVMILISSKHEFNLDKDFELHLPSLANDGQGIPVVEHSVDSNEEATKLRVCDTVVTEYSKASEDDYSDNKYDTGDKDESYEEGDDELTKRIEEFIAKVNREWRDEILKDI